MSRVLAAFRTARSPFAFASTGAGAATAAGRDHRPDQRRAAVSGPDVTVTIQVTGTTLVPAAEATKLEDMHVHYMLDVDPAPYLSGTTPIPHGQPEHRPLRRRCPTRSPAWRPARTQVAVVLGLSNHVAVQPPVAPSVSFTVGRRSRAGPASAHGRCERPDPTHPGSRRESAARARHRPAGLARRRLRLGHRR